jgi:exodeoxyribonuclease-1
LHETAHDALSDVRATIALARLLRDKQPRLFEFCLGMHKKDRVAQEMGLHLEASLRQPFLHVSGMFPAERGCISLVWPIGHHPTNKNEVLVWDCKHHPGELFELDVETVRLRLFTRTADLPEGVTRLPIKSIHVNKSPMLVSNLKTLSAEMATRWGIDIAEALSHAQVAAAGPDLRALWEQVYHKAPSAQEIDVDEDLYGGFVSTNDKRKLESLRRESPERLATSRPSFEDERLEELLFRYRARNFPDSLSEADALRWEQHRAARLLHGAGNARTIQQLQEEIDGLAEAADERAEEILSALYDYADQIAPGEYY